MKVKLFFTKLQDLLPQKAFIALLIFTLLLPTALPQTTSAQTIPSFSTPVNVSNTLASSKIPSVAVDHYGTVHTVWWEDPRPSNSQIVYAARNQDGTWSAPLTISDQTMPSVHGHIAADGFGALHVIWYADDGLGGDVFYATKPVGGTWSMPTQIADGQCNSVTASTTPLAVGPDGTVHVTCDLYASAVFYTMKPPGGNWTQALQITGESSGANSVVALDQAGGVHVAWQNFISGQIMYATKPVDGGWTAPTSISNTVSAARPTITTDVTGQIHVAWQDRSLGPEQIYFVTKAADGIWNTPINLSNTASPSVFPSLASEGNRLHLAWEKGGDPGGNPNPTSGGDILYRARGLDGLWSVSESISEDPGFAGYPELSIGGGALHLVWSEVAPNGNLDIFWAKRNLDNTPPTVTPIIDGTLGNNSWYTSNVTVSWDVEDPESEVTSTTGCDPSSVTADTAGITFTCEATSAGGTSSESVTIKRDATAPTVAITSPDNFAVVPTGTSLNFSANDNLSGIQSVTGSLSDGTTTTNITSGYQVNQPGVYTLTVEAMDSAGNTASETRYFVVYDPAAGFATGGGWLTPGGQTSDSGDFLPNIDNSSPANFGFVIKYKPGATTPNGQLEFQYQQGDFNLHSTGMEWLVVVNNNWAKFQGKATIKGLSGEFPFRVDARDGDYGGGNQADRFIIKIWTPGVNPDLADPIYKASGDLQGGNIIIHTN